MMQLEKILPLPPVEAERLITDFLAADKNQVDPATNVQRLAESKPS
jgi:hypothetical protein